MISKLELVNFQKHKNLTVDFTAGVNTIVGSSDRGKSSIIRALQLVFFNKPNGTAFITHGEKECRVTVTMTNGDVISRIRSSSKNEYVINDLPVKAPGREVPMEVSAICNMTDINVQGQHDSPFMLSESSGEVGRMLNQLVDLSVIDKVLSTLNSKKQDTNKRMAFVADEVKDLDQELADFPDTDTIEDRLLSLEKMSAKINVNNEHMQRVRAVIGDVTDKLSEIKVFSHLDEASERLAKLGLMSDSCVQKKIRIEELRINVRDALRAIDELKAHTESIEGMQEDIDEMMGDSCPLCGSKKEVESNA